MFVWESRPHLPLTRVYVSCNAEPLLVFCAGLALVGAARKLWVAGEKMLNERELVRVYGTDPQTPQFLINLCMVIFCSDHNSIHDLVIASFWFSESTFALRPPLLRPTHVCDPLQPRSCHTSQTSWCPHHPRRPFDCGGHHRCCSCSLASLHSANKSCRVFSGPPSFFLDYNSPMPYHAFVPPVVQ